MKPTQQLPLFDPVAPKAITSVAKQTATQKNKYSSYVVYVDESGDHGMLRADDSYPVFVLAFCVFHKYHYSSSVVTGLHQFKFKHFGHDLSILHEHEIRKETGDFKFPNRAAKEAFMAELTQLIVDSNFVLISCVIDKQALMSKGGVPLNPYHLALGFCLETLHEFLIEKNQADQLTHVIVECRGKKEDDELELVFRRICDGDNRWQKRLSLDVKFADKKVNSVGLQLADLVARPIGLNTLRPAQENRAFDVLKHKFFCSGGRVNTGVGFENWGLKIYPTPESEKPR